MIKGFNLKRGRYKSWKLVGCAHVIADGANPQTVIAPVGKHDAVGVRVQDVDDRVRLDEAFDLAQDQRPLQLKERKKKNDRSLQGESGVPAPDSSNVESRDQRPHLLFNPDHRVTVTSQSSCMTNTGRFFSCHTLT